MRRRVVLGKFSRHAQKDEEEEQEQEEDIQDSDESESELITKDTLFDEITKNQLLEIYTQSEQITPKLESLQEYYQNFQSNTTIEKFNGLIMIRKLTGIIDPPFKYENFLDQIIGLNIIPSLIQIIDTQKNVLFAYEAIWIITNIASGNKNHVQFLIQSGVLISVYNLFSNQHSSLIQNQILWTIGNIAGDCKEFNDQICSYGFQDLLIKYLKVKKSSENTKTALWALGNIIQYNNDLKQDQQIQIVTIFNKFLNNQNSMIVKEAVQGLQYLIEKYSFNIISQDNKSIKIIIQLLSYNDEIMLENLLNIILNLLSSIEITQFILKEGFISSIEYLLKQNKKYLNRQRKILILQCILKIIENLQSSTIIMFNQIIYQNLFENLVLSNLNTGIKTIQFAIEKLKDNELLTLITQQKLFHYLIGNIIQQNELLIISYLENIEKIFQRAQNMEQLDIVIKQFEIENCTTKLEQLQHHANDQIYQKTSLIIQTYFVFE